MKEKYKKENLSKIVAESFSLSEVLRKIGLESKGSNHKTLSKYIDVYGLDTSHFRGQTWNKGMANTDYTASVKLDEVLTQNTNFASSILKKRLIKEGLKQNVCEICGCDGTWMDKPITLELHHINGDHYDNRIENLQILCPNCHSQTENYRKRYEIRGNKPKPKKRKEYICICQNCGKEFKSDRERKFCCRECYNSSLAVDTKLHSVKITKEELYNKMKEIGTLSKLGEYFSTSRTTIRKLLDEYGLLTEYKENYNTETLHNKVVIQYDLNMNPIKEWGSISDAQETLKLHKVGEVCSFKRKTCGGFIWRFKEES